MPKDIKSLVKKVIMSLPYLKGMRKDYCNMLVNRDATVMVRLLMYNLNACVCYLFVYI